MNSYQNKNQHTSSSSSHRPGLVHSTHSHLETFDQATRDSQLEQESSSSSSSQFSSETMAAPTLQVGTNSESALRGAHSAVQLDRDVQHSRKIADENRQKASGNARSAPVDSQNELSYVE